MDEKYTELKNLIGKMGSVVVAFSGGVDSSLLLAAARDALGDAVLAVSAISASYPERDLDDARELAALLEARHRVIETDEVEHPAYKANPPDRCYFCKQRLFIHLRRLADQEGYAQVLEGSNIDDTADFRPGIQAARDLEIRSPLIEAGISKDQVRMLARRRGLSNWDKPASACLASRVPYGTEITPERLKRIERAESLMHEIGLRQVRARDHGEVVRIEVAKEEMWLFLDEAFRQKAVDKLKSAGFSYISLDLQGYRSGSMNDVVHRAGCSRTVCSKSGLGNGESCSQP